MATLSTSSSILTSVTSGKDLWEAEKDALVHQTWLSQVRTKGGHSDRFTLRPMHVFSFSMVIPSLTRANKTHHINELTVFVYLLCIRHCAYLMNILPLWSFIMKIKFLWNTKYSCPGWCGPVGWSIVPHQKVTVRFPGRTHTQVVGSMPGQDRCGRQQIHVSFSHWFSSLCPPLSTKI